MIVVTTTMNNNPLLDISVTLVHIFLFTDNILHLHYNETEHKCEAVSGKNDKIARNCLVSTLNCIVKQTNKIVCEKGYFSATFCELFTVWDKIEV